MNGALEYTLGLNSAQFESAIKNSDAAVINFGKDVHGVGEITGQTTRTMVMNFHEMSEATHGAREGLEAFGHAAELVGYNIAPQMTLSVRTMIETVKSANTAAKLAGMSLAEIGLTAIGVVAAGAMLVTGYDAIKAKLQELDSNKALENQYTLLESKLIPQLEKLMTLGRIDIKTGHGLEDMLRQAHGVAAEQKALKAAQGAIRGVLNQDLQTLAGKSLDAFLHNNEARQLMSPRDREKDEFKLQQDERLTQALDLAKKAGRPEQPIVDLFNKVNKEALAAIDKKYDDQAKPSGPLRHIGPELPHSELERIGLVFKGGSGGRSYEKSMDDSLKKLVSLIEKRREVRAENVTDMILNF